jgi:GR25 family glycosyltransferase involved in LPS biosynthesis
MSSMCESIDKIYIINLKNRTDRWKLCLEQLQKYNITNYKRFNAIKPDLKKIKKIHYSKNNLRIGGNKYIIGALGCKLSHLNIVQEAKKNGYKKILILEDDFLLTKDFIDKLQKVMKDIEDNKIHINMLYLGFSIIRKNPYKDTVIPNLKQITNGHTTHAYMLNSEFYDTIIKEVTTCYCEIDVCYANMQKKYKGIYGVYPCLISQRESYSDILCKKVNYEKCITLDTK